MKAKLFPVDFTLAILGKWDKFILSVYIFAGAFAMCWAFNRLITKYLPKCIDAVARMITKK